MHLVLEDAGGSNGKGSSSQVMGSVHSAVLADISHPVAAGEWWWSSARARCTLYLHMPWQSVHLHRVLAEAALAIRTQLTGIGQVAL